MALYCAGKRHLMTAVALVMVMAIATGRELYAAAPAKSITAKDGAEMVLVPAGPFLMGSLEGDADERPPHRVYLKAYYIDKYEVTHEQYARFLKATGRKPPVDWPGGEMPAQLARHPVVNVSFEDAAAYACWAGKRLPTEAEWEKAARGTNGWTFPWGNDPGNKKTASGAEGKEKTWPVGSFPDDVSPYGCHDMAGNVWEWTSSWYEAYPGNSQRELEYGKKFKVIRGGGAIAYYQAESTRRTTDRARSVPYGTYDGLGFRCVKDL
ncbi:formylglycine-generating enzyme family protein [Fontisphaera persica]|uniref:formylglycine-generating enzyme family protein n=1 Tax=Fontisphaera persica TaxID=2974023 RepID=UPI0024BF86D7|nr:formylglycine-generating enzyme family protein [Fontisphaera persica]WCJ60395.1 formylglycine-generating enzyme family protein [Fontisphaera persica]